MYKSVFNHREVIVFKQFTHKGWSLFACLGRVVVIGVLSASTLRNADAASQTSVITDVQPDDSTAVQREMTLDDIDVTASRAPLALGQAARMVTVLSRDEIQAAPVQSVNDLLKYVAGVDVRQRGPLGAQTDVTIRGGTQEQITVLLNGVNICDPQTGHNTFDIPVSLSDIVRIEVLEGPAARIYGTSSLIGAINIVTFSAEPNTGNKSINGKAMIEAGSYGYLAADAAINHTTSFASLQTLKQGLSLGFSRSDGYSRAKSGQLNSDYQGVKAFWQGQAILSDATSVQWHAGTSIKGFGANTFYSAKFDEQYEHTARLFTALQAQTNVGAFHIKPSIYWNRSHDRFELIRGQEQAVPFNRHRTDVFGLAVNAWFDSPIGRTALGAEFRNEDILSTNLGEPIQFQTVSPSDKYKCSLNRSNLSLHLEHNVVTSHFTLSAGFVAVKNTWNQMPFTIYPGVDASLRLGDHFKLYASYNASLRMPTFTELYYSVGGHKADKYLKPEELQAVEAGVKFYSTNVMARISAFHHHQTNTIDWILDTRMQDPVWQSVNLTKINTLGLQAELTVNLRHSAFNISYCYLNQQKDVNEFLQSRYSLEYLRHKLTARWTLQLPAQLKLVLSARYHHRTGSYTDTQGNVCQYDPYVVFDSRLQWDRENYALFLEALNLSAIRYVDYGNVPQPGLWINGGVKISF